MALIIKEIKLEVSKPNLIQAIVAKQNDCNSRFLKVSLWDEGTQLSINPSAEVTINAERNDGKSDSFFGEVNEDNTATVPLHSWMLELEGTVNCDVSIIVDGRRLTTTTFVVKVEKAACGSDDIIDNPQYDVLTNLINEVNAQGDVAKNTFASAIKGTASGNPILLDDVSPLEHEMAVGVNSKNLVAYPYKETTKTVNGITFTGNGDGTVTINGTATANATFNLADYGEWGIKQGVNYTASINQVSGSGRASFVVNYYKVGASSYSGWLNVQIGTNKTNPCPDDFSSIRSYILVNSGETCSNLVISVQLEQGTTATAYTPYVDVNGAKVHKLGKNISETFTADENGKVNGIIGNGEDITLMGDGVTITAEYNTDTKKYIDKKFAELAAMLVSE